MARTCISRAAIRRILNLGFFGNRLLPLTAVAAAATTLCLLLCFFMNFSLRRLVRISRLHLLRPFAVTAKTLSATSRTALPPFGAAGDEGGLSRSIRSAPRSLDE
nr:unnamed protein product [Ipomoea batatas]